MTKINYSIRQESKVADILIDNEQLIYMLERFNIPLGIGNMSFTDIAEKYNIEINALLNIGKVTIGESPVWDECNTKSVNDIVSFLKKSHKSLQSNKISVVNDLISNYSKEIPENFGVMLKSFFQKYIEDVTEHFNFEDKIVFPYIIQLNKTYEEGTYEDFDFNIEKFQGNHSDIEQKLRDLKNILIRHIPPHIKSTYRNMILLKLYDLETDITLHSQIEDMILIPLIKKIETDYHTKKQ